jgi:signal transduction histidine kinase
MLEGFEKEYIKETNIANLIDNARFLRDVFDGIRDQIMVVDSEYRIEDVNAALIERLNIKKHTIIGKRCFEVLHDLDGPCDLPNHPCPVQDALKTGTPHEVLHTHYMGRDSTYYRVMAYPVLDDKGKVIRVIEMARNVTKWKKGGDQIYNVQKLVFLGKLASGVAHELNNPVAVILGFADLLLEKLQPDNPSYELLKTIERQGLNCKRIVENLLSFAKQPETTQYSSDVNENIEKVLSVIESMLYMRKITLEKELAEDLPSARGDAGHLQQVFMNLIANAVAAMGEGGTLTISTRHSDNYSRIEVVFRDTGHGIKKEYRDKVFDPFFTTREVGEGTGLGLSACYGMVSNYGGHITFESVTEDEDGERRGTTFIVSLPAVHS